MISGVSSFNNFPAHFPEEINFEVALFSTQGSMLYMFQLQKLEFFPTARMGSLKTWFRGSAHSTIFKRTFPMNTILKLHHFKLKGPCLTCFNCRNLSFSSRLGLGASKHDCGGQLIQQFSSALSRWNKFWNCTILNSREYASHVSTAETWVSPHG